jgi:hypothetical protein
MASIAAAGGTNVRGLAEGMQRCIHPDDFTESEEPIAPRVKGVPTQQPLYQSPRLVNDIVRRGQAPAFSHRTFETLDRLRVEPVGSIEDGVESCSVAELSDIPVASWGPSRRRASGILRTGQRVCGGIASTGADRLGEVPIRVEEIQKQSDCVTQIDLGVVVGVRRVLARRRGTAAEQALQDEDCIGNVRKAVGICISTLEGSLPRPKLASKRCDAGRAKTRITFEGFR